MQTDEIKRLIDVVAKLCDPVSGCPWDSVQTNMSIRRYLVEETGEYLDALEDGDDHAVMDELGDLLLQIVMNAQIAENEHRFNLEDVASSEADKMIRRHPHVFGESNAKTENELKAQWERIKHTEQGYNQRKSALDGVPRSVPGLQRAQKTASKARRGGFQWQTPQEALNKVQEELDEVKALMSNGTQEQLSEEIGDLLFAITVFCQMKEVQAEEAAHAAIKKFTKRFHALEALLDDKGLEMKSCAPEQLLELWGQVKDKK